MENSILGPCKKCGDHLNPCRCKLESQLAEARKALLEIKEELEYDISNGKVALDIATDTLT